LQTEAADYVGISKQAMSQRLAAAGWQAEQAGWMLAVHMLRRVTELV
ncbi:MAG: DNA-binding protein, partial [Corynebacterium variabile]|nr:DNA-binding protein [Corynebacterium variabile]